MPNKTHTSASLPGQVTLVMEAEQFQPEGLISVRRAQILWLPTCNILQSYSQIMKCNFTGSSPPLRPIIKFLIWLEMSGLFLKVANKLDMESFGERQCSGSQSMKEIHTIAWLCSQSHAKVHKMWKKGMVQYQNQLENWVETSQDAWKW